MGKKHITGSYTRYGYIIEETKIANGESGDYPLYEAGNYTLESTTVVRPDSNFALDLDQIRKFCEEQVLEFAAETGLEAGPSWHDLDRENDLDRIYYGEEVEAA